MSRDVELVEIDFDHVEASTRDAILFVIDDREVWVPRSLIVDGESIYDDEEDGSFEVPEWWAEKEGLI